MARVASKTRVPKVVDTSADDEAENGGSAYRVSITVDQSIRRNMRIAAAVNDMEVGQWAAKVLERAASKALEDEGVGQ